MSFIHETANFILESHDKPEIDRLDGGHMKISPKASVTDRTCLDPALAIELMRFTIIAGKAMKSGLAKRGIDIGRINYQDNGNWKPELHVHLYGRATGARYQKYGEPITPGNKEHYLPLDELDIKEIKKEIRSLFNAEEFNDRIWFANKENNDAL